MSDSVVATVTATLPGRIVARTHDGREVCFSKIAILSKRVGIGSPVLLSGIKPRRDELWADSVEIDPARLEMQDRVLAQQDLHLGAVALTFDGVIEEFNGDLVRARLSDGRDVWFKSSKCRDYRGHLGLRVKVTVQPERVQAVEIASEDVERNRRLCKELEPKPVAPLRVGKKL